jgi:hypothetical protein
VDKQIIEDLYPLMYPFGTNNFLDIIIENPEVYKGTVLNVIIKTLIEMLYQTRLLVLTTLQKSLIQMASYGSLHLKWKMILFLLSFPQKKDISSHIQQYW